MADYTVEKIDNGIATLRYADSSWAEVVLSSDMTEEKLDDLALQYAPKTGAKPSFLSVGQNRTAAAIEIKASEDERAAYIIARTKAYGLLEEQIEYITENGLDKW
tara:strand:- start:99 stop:413 length:315 start_codon:yes stop_codon:yes gene_type:complete